MSKGPKRESATQLRAGPRPLTKKTVAWRITLTHQPRGDHRSVIRNSRAQTAAGNEMGEGAGWDAQ